ncbi:hypothetical protein ACWEV4_32690 [Streptomyces sp. NPDC003860]
MSAAPTGLDALYPDGAWDLPVSPSLPAPRRAAPPPELHNTTGYKEHYGPNVLADYPLDGGDRLAVIDKAFPHALHDLMLLAARDDQLRTHVADTPDPVLAALLTGARTFADFLSTPAVLRAFGLDGARAMIAWNHDQTLDRDNGQWWDKRLHLHLNCWPRALHHTSTPVPLHAVTDPGARRSLIDPVAYLAHRILTDALHHHGALPDLTVLGPDPARDAREHLPAGLKIRLPGWPYVTTPDFRALLRTLHTTAETAYRQIRACFTGTPALTLPWRRPRLLPAPDVARRLGHLPWLSPPARDGLTALRAALRDVTDRQLVLLQARRPWANRSLSLGGLSYNIALHNPHPTTATKPLTSGPLWLVMQLKLISYVGSSPAIGGAVASLIDRTHGPVLTPGDHAQRRAFQAAFTDHLTTTLTGDGP